MKGKSVAFILALSLFVVMNASAFSTAVGGEFALKVGDGLPNSALLSFHVPSLPPVFGLGATLGSDGRQASLVVLADWWLAKGNLTGALDYYLGPGFFVAISDDAQLGFRVPLGLDCYPIKPLELFLEFAPAMTLIDTTGVDIPQWGVQAGFGFRFWF
jgi:hypothetical protein